MSLKKKTADAPDVNVFQFSCPLSFAIGEGRKSSSISLVMDIRHLKEPRKQKHKQHGQKTTNIKSRKNLWSERNPFNGKETVVGNEVGHKLY